MIVDVRGADGVGGKGPWVDLALTLGSFLFGEAAAIVGRARREGRGAAVVGRGRRRPAWPWYSMQATED